ncbi:MAG: hypothetical protein LBM62_05175 [Mediterranea sp.]|jgi:hypothetical protein|nr:hypothetical protein [Mediterranea sp.]
MKQYGGILKLVCLLVVAPLVIWQATLKSTYGLHRENVRLQQQSRLSSPLQPSSASAVKETVISEPLLSNGKIMQVMAETLRTHEVSVMNYRPEVVRAEGQNSLYLGTLTLTGRFRELVKVLHETEQMDLSVKIASVNFEYDRTRRNTPKTVTCRIFLEQIEQQH